MNEIQRIRHLQSKVRTFYEYIETCKYQFVNRDYTANHETMIYATQCVEEYQVISGYDVEIDYEDIFLSDEDYDKLIESDIDIDEVIYNFDYKEILQIWLNTNNGNMVFLARTKINPYYYFNFDANWVPINTGKKAYLYNDVYEFCKNPNVSAFWMDFSVHPVLKSRGYEGINAWDYHYYDGNEEDFSENGKFIFNHNMIEELQKLVLGTSELEKQFKIFGFEQTIHINAILDEQFRKAYRVAAKIANRHHYQITDINLWDDMIQALYHLNKDLHNPFYVCPSNLIEAHDKYCDMWRKKQELDYKLQKRNEERELNELKEKQDKLIKERSEKFFNLLFIQDNITIIPLLTYEDYEMEGHSMHHCVATYFTNTNSLILSARDTLNNRLATIEVSLTSFNIVQCKGVENTVPQQYDTINTIIMNHMQEIKEIKLKMLPKTA